MPNLPGAEIDVTEQLVRRLLTEQHPDLASLPLRRLANGWDNVLFRLGDELTVRLPRRAQAAELIRHEQRWLPVLAAALPVQIPVPLRTGIPAPHYPWAWSVAPWIDGETAAVVPAAERCSIAEQLAGVIAALHRPAPQDAPANPVRGVPLRTRHSAMLQRLSAGVLADPEPAAALWDELRAVPDWAGPALWVHGDLHPANLLLADGKLRAVLDFGDLTAGDPATDLATAWLTFDAAGRRIFMDRVNEHGGVDAATWQRARGWALVMGTALLAASDDHPMLRRVGEHALAQVLLIP